MVPKTNRQWKPLHQEDNITLVTGAVLDCGKKNPTSHGQKLPYYHSYAPVYCEHTRRLVV